MPQNDRNNASLAGRWREKCERKSEMDEVERGGKMGGERKGKGRESIERAMGAR